MLVILPIRTVKVVLTERHLFRTCVKNDATEINIAEKETNFPI